MGFKEQMNLEGIPLEGFYKMVGLVDATDEEKVDGLKKVVNMKPIEKEPLRVLSMSEQLQAYETGYQITYEKDSSISRGDYNEVVSEEDFVK